MVQYVRMSCRFEDLKSTAGHIVGGNFAIRYETNIEDGCFLQI